jgi:hypothetical protein
MDAAHHLHKSEPLVEALRNDEAALLQLRQADDWLPSHVVSAAQWESLELGLKGKSQTEVWPSPGSAELS